MSNVYSINITCPRCQFRGDVEADFPCGHEDLAEKVATLTAERDAAREEVAMGRKAMGILAFELERMKAERDAARQQLEDLAYSHSLCGDLRDECINAETEACAQLANWHLNNIERLRPSANDGWLKGYRDACADLESAIRARGAK